MGPSTEHIWEKTVGTGRCRVSLLLINTGQGINALLTGGELPHIGGVVMAVPRPSLDKDKSQTSADYYVLPVPGHKDVEAAKVAAEVLVKKYKKTVAVTCGIHSDRIDPREIRQIMDYCKELAEQAPLAF